MDTIAAYKLQGCSKQISSGQAISYTWLIMVTIASVVDATIAVQVAESGQAKAWPAWLLATWWPCKEVKIKLLSLYKLFEIWPISFDIIDWLVANPF